MDQERLYEALRKADAAGDTESAKKLADFIRSQQGGDAPSEPKKSFGDQLKQQVGNVIAGGVRGAGSIGATILSPVDAAARAVGIENSFIGRKDRREAMDGGLGELGAETDSFAYGAGKLGGEVAGTLGIGTPLAVGARAVPVLSKLAPYIASSGMQTGNMGARMAGGAITGGAAAGLVNPGEASTGALVGGLLPPALRGVEAVSRAAGVALGAPKAIVRPFTLKGQDDIAAEILQKSATNPTQAAKSLKSARPLVPGSEPTVAQIANDPGLAQLERTLLNNPEMAAPLQQRYANQRAARMSALNEVAGTDEYFDAIKEGRRVFANEDYAKALKGGIDPDAAAAIQPQIESLMGRPSIKQAQSVAQRLARESDRTIDDFGSLEGMDWLKKALDNQISKASQPGSSIGKEELRALTQTKSDLMATIEQIAPSYREANDNFAHMSRQVNSMEVARDLKRRFEPALNRFGATGKEMANEYAKALEGATTSVKKSAGIDRPLAQVMPAQDIERLNNIARDLARKSTAESAGKASGSPTAQNIVSQTLIDRLSSQLGLPASVSESGVGRVALSPYQGLANLSGATQSINDLLANALLNPSQAASLLSRPASQGLLAPGAGSAAARRGLLELGYRTAPVLSAQ
ncbi:MAG: hypothetical protein KIT86_00640 [Hydrogenophaga sp.]|jgi:hypothetical protein|uniref:hypothetical protein n=1 Tax=Hydrogenophaga sp. TaxID=1904254 RepID=UPI00262A454B|nr:hypothetical protein [Hydrogenophaga sp.]MCW5668133.1 hypothetical protein [Hydrogenophaga sp.]